MPVVIEEKFESRLSVAGDNPSAAANRTTEASVALFRPYSSSRR